MIKINYPQSNEILFLRGDINYTEFHLVDGKKVVSSFTLLRHQEKLGSFIRVSKNHLVNPDYVKEMEHYGVYASLKMANGNLLKISRRRINYVKNSISIIK
ncbi:LytTR family transcriptional regulator [Lacihabitans sp. LS3-19]|uniref:LytTR family DNA-binding domain-containing protein n=1 Tax=Lacihabitans sp. LS3-19 TaxID=2487335 RepID=UPI0020CE1417|nr:LytTR family DNA-binding domain-containing protein [Lacihabitans sp. LS3-19]MCP9768788.1 LytTR family transcriptional regulator [Lacihabitans sp. LS3-19]